MILSKLIEKGGSLLSPKKSRTLFLYGGCLHHWPGMGRTLYEKEKVFRESVDDTDQLIRNAGLPGILPHFEGTAAPDFLSDGSRDYTVTVAVQMAFTDLWRSRGVYPAAALGQSLGEAAALYAAGGISKAEVVRIAGAMALSRLPSEYVLLYVQADMRHRVFCNSPVFLFPTYEAGNGESIAVCHQSKLTEAGNYLDRSGISWRQFADAHFSPIHTPLLVEKLPFFQSMLKDVAPQPLGCDYYSCALARKVPRHSLVPFDFFEKVLVTPVQMHDAVKEALKDGFQAALNISSHSFMGSSVQKAASGAAVKIKILHSLEEGQPEEEQFQRTFREWKKLNFLRSANSEPVATAGVDRFPAFISQFEFRSGMTPAYWLAALSYMRSRGGVHFIPKFPCWLVVDYDTAEVMLQDTGSFSSMAYRDFDSSLLGTDPPEHTAVRAMVQPSFIPKSIKYLDEVARQTISKHFESVAQLPEFDLARQVYMPSTMAINGQILGIAQEDVQELIDAMPEDINDPGHDKVEQFFQRYLQRNSDRRTYGGMGGTLLELEEAGKLSRERAVGLMKLFWTAGSGTTYMQLSYLSHLLLTRRDLAARLKDDQELIPKFVEESLRLAPPPFVHRITTRDVVLDGKSIPAGSVIVVSLMAVNRDSKHFSDADEFRLDRPAKRNFSFGSGAHHCVGSHVARMVSNEFVKAFLPLADSLESVPLQPPSFIVTMEVNGAYRMPVRWKK
jgi:cytochrome P450